MGKLLWKAGAPTRGNRRSISRRKPTDIDEGVQAEQICGLAHQLWLRGLLMADTGLISVETHRKRCLATRLGRRRTNLSSLDLMTVDLGGMVLDGGGGLGVGATILANPPMTTAMLQRHPETVGTLDFEPYCTIAEIAAGDDQAIKVAVEVHQCFAIRSLGLLCIACNLDSVVNRLENIEHSLTVELTRGGTY